MSLAAGEERCTLLYSVTVSSDDYDTLCGIADQYAPSGIFCAVYG